MGVMRARVLVLATALLLTGQGAAASAAGHSRLVFAAAEEVSTLHGFTTGQVPDPSTYWTVERDLSAYTPAVWAELKRRRAWITVNMRWQRDFGPVPAGMPQFGELLPFLRTARANGVGVVAWLTVPYADGYWATEDNVAENAQMVRDFDAWARAVGFRPKQVLLDLEAPLTDTATANQAFRDPVSVIEMLNRNVGPDQQCAAMHGYEDIAAWLEDHGHPTIAAAYSFLFDDIRDGNVALSDGLDMPLPRPGTFREVAFMAMRSVYAALTGSDPGPSIHSAYIRQMKRWFGGSATFSLGEAGEGPYEDLGEMVRDTRLAAALTTGTVGIYSLDKALGAYGLDGVSRLFDAVEHPLAGEELRSAAKISAGAREARALIGAENAMVSAGLPLAMAARGAPQLPNAWPPRC